MTSRHNDARDILLALGVEINAAHSAGALVEANVVEAFKARSRDRLDLVVGHKKVLLPSHEQVLFLGKIPEGEAWGLCLLGQWSPRLESRPVLHINLFRRAPLGMCCFERVLVPYNLALKIGGQGWVVVREACFASVCSMGRAMSLCPTLDA